jgi:proline dehydrogenase
MAFEKPTNVCFDDTASAFAYKSESELKKAVRLFGLMGLSWLTKIGTRITPLLINMRLPFIKTILRRTIFKQFVGGESLQETIPVLHTLKQNHVKVILDYGVEGASNESSFDHTTQTFNEVIRFAAVQSNVPHISIKLTGLCTFSLLEKIDALMKSGTSNDLITTLTNALTNLTIEESDAWKRTEKRLEEICNTAYECQVSILIDAEESWIQDPVDALTHQMMRKFNRQKAIIYNTIQLYRHDRIAFLKKMHMDAAQHVYLLAVKLVRGAYMEKERKRANDMNYPCPIQPNKASSDRDFNLAMTYCLDNISQIACIIASHNEDSNLLATQQLLHKNIIPAHSHVHFSQLYGMSDHITFNLAKAGYSVSKYLPFGPIEDVIPYLMRRAQENSSVSGQTGRELSLLKKEIYRRANVKD